MVEQRSPKPRAEGSSPSAPAKRQLSPTGLSCFFVRASRRRTSNPKDLAFALCKVLTGTGSGAKIVQQSFCPCQKVSQSFWIGLFFYPRWTRGMRSVPGKNPDCRLRREEGGILGAAVKGDSDEQDRPSALETARGLAKQPIFIPPYHFLDRPLDLIGII